MLSASKLCQSVSTSGPSATWKPSPTNTSSSRSHAWVTMCGAAAARLAGELGEVEALGCDLPVTLGRGELVAPGGERRVGGASSPR